MFGRTPSEVDGSTHDNSADLDAGDAHGLLHTCRYKTIASTPVKRCHALCDADPGCTGVEYHPAARVCKLVDYVLFWYAANPAPEDGRSSLRLCFLCFFCVFFVVWAFTDCNRNRALRPLKHFLMRFPSCFPACTLCCMRSGWFVFV